MHNLWQALHRFIAISALLVVGISTQAENKPADQKYTAVLVWGTNGEKPTDQNLKDIDAKLIEKFKFFKWKNYYEVTRKEFSLKTGEPKNVELSEKCKVNLHLTERDGLEYELLGEGKSVYKGKQGMPLKEALIIGGDDKNATAWFVVLKPQ